MSEQSVLGQTMKEPHPLLQAGKLLLSDVLSTLAFIGIYAITDRLAVAVGISIVLGLVQVAVMKRNGTKIDAIQWLSLFLVFVFGGASVFTHNPIFIKLSPSLIYAAVGIVMLKPGWMNRYVPPRAKLLAGDITTVFGFIWAVTMLSIAVCNLALAFGSSHAAWSWFVGTVPIGAKIVLIPAQYLVTRVIVRRRMRMPEAGTLAA